MELARRKAIKAMVAASILGVFNTSQQARAQENYISKSPINIILPRGYSPPLQGKDSTNYQYRLKVAVLDYLEKYFSHSKLPFWKSSLNEIDMEKRIINIIYWIMYGLRQQKRSYMPDPSWILAQIMTESYFYEFALSGDFAAGICQFIPSTAQYYHLVTPGTSKLARHSLKQSKFAGELERYYSLWEKLDNLESQYNRLFGNERKFIYELLETQIQGQNLPEAAQYMEALNKAEEIRADTREAHKNYKDFILANYKRVLKRAVNLL